MPLKVKFRLNTKWIFVLIYSHQLDCRSVLKSLLVNQKQPITVQMLAVVSRLWFTNNRHVGCRVSVECARLSMNYSFDIAGTLQLFFCLFDFCRSTPFLEQSEATLTTHSSDICVAFSCFFVSCSVWAQPQATAEMRGALTFQPLGIQAERTGGLYFFHTV